MYELFEHTADLGLRVRAPDLETLFRDAATGLFAMIAENGPEDEAGERLELQVEGTRNDYLLLDWLNELLYTFESRRLLLDRFEVQVDAVGLRGAARARPFDRERSRPLHEVKAITYHELKVVQERDGWLAEVIVDI